MTGNRRQKQLLLRSPGDGNDGADDLVEAVGLVAFAPQDSRAGKRRYFGFRSAG